MTDDKATSTAAEVLRDLKRERKKRTEAWTDRTRALRDDPHVQEQVRRVMEPLTLIQGARGVQSYEDVLSTVAQLIATLEVMPEIDTTANNGGITVSRGPMEGYSIHLHAADVYIMRLTPYTVELLRPGSGMSGGTSAQEIDRSARDAWKEARP